MLKLKLTVAATLLAALSGAQAQTNDELRRIIAQAMPPVIGKSNVELVNRILTVKPGATPISRGFDPVRATRLLFGRGGATPAPDCTATQTSVGEADEGLCFLTSGKREDPTGAFTQLAYSKNIGQLGNIRFIKRPAFDPNGFTAPPEVRMTDLQAYELALKTLEGLGVPQDEIPRAPVDAKNPLPVRSVAMGVNQENATSGGLLLPAVQKVVFLQRALPFEGFSVPGTNIVIDRLAVPGSAAVVINDSGVQAALVEEWSDAQIDKKIDPRLAKSVDELVDEIADDLKAEGVDRVGTVSILIGLRKAYPNPFDDSSPSCPRCAVLRPSLKVIVSQVPAGRIDPAAQAFVAPGVVREYDLVDATEAEIPAR